MLTFLASAAYLVTAALSLIVALAPLGGKSGQLPSVRRFWLLAGAFFVLLAAMRMIDAEDAIRHLLRDWLVADGEYSTRRAIQAPIVVLLLCGLIGTALWARRRPKKGGVPTSRPVRWARRGIAAMAVLIVVRLISFHPVDVLLYRGFRFNWVIDIGTTVLVAACAIVSLRAATPRRRATANGGRSDRRR